MRRPHALWSLAFVFVACSGGGDDDGTDDTVSRDGGTTVSGPGPFTLCSAAERVGGIAVTLEESYTRVQGSIADGVKPSDVPMVAQEAGECRLLRPKTLFCDPACSGGTTCNDDGTCVPLPSNQSVGTITIEGLTAAVTLEARPPVYFYNFTGDLPHPGFAEGDEVRLVADAFTIETVGVAPLVVATASLAIARDAPAVVEWTAGAANDSVRLEIELSIANHGGTPGRVHCLADDTGRFEIPAALVTALLDLGYSGFPTVAIAREGVNVARPSYGCVDLRTRSAVVLPVEIPGLVSCSDSNDCPTGQTCQPDLTCQ